MRLLLFGAIVSVIPIPPAHADDAVARGRYLSVLGDCAGCHTGMHGAAFTGGLPFDTPFGTIYSTNITPDKVTGIGIWSADDFYRALHDGIAPGGTHLYPALPYLYFNRITRRDSDDLFAYLRTLRPVHRVSTPNRLAFPFNLRFGLAIWNALYFDKTPPAVPANASAAWKRGEYLVNGLGHCGACHTPKTALFGDIKGRALTGGTVTHWFAANLTGSTVDGLGTWRHDDVVQFLATGHNRYAIAAGSMQEKVTSSTSHMRDADRSAIATYLKSLPPAESQDVRMASPQQRAAGQAVFVAHCKACHQPDQADPSPDYPQLAGDTLVLGRDPATVVRIILEGASAPVTPNAPNGYSMPSFATLSDDQIADVATYIRESWGNRATPVAARDVMALRAALAQ